MDKKILVDAVYPNNLQVAVVEDGRLEGIEYANAVKKLIKGNIYLAKITRIEPSLQAAFLDYGEDKNGFISFSEIHPDYYNVPFKYRAPNEQDQNECDGNIEDTPTLKEEYSEPLENSNVENAILENDVDNVSPDEESNIEKVKQANAEKYKIQEVLKKDQILLVQVVKEVRGNKGAMLTTYISLAGKYCVVMPNCDSSGGISRRITDVTVRKELQKIFDEINKKVQLSFIIRTAGQGHNKKAIQTDYNYLVKVWNNIREKTLSASAPAFIHAEDDILKKTIRDLYDQDTQEIVVQGEEAYKNIVSTIKLMALTRSVKVKKYIEDMPIFNKFKVDEQISFLYNSIVCLKSGAYIVINQTEALTAIDINSGRSTSERNVEETAIKTNIEAAKEIVRQIRLRDLSGLIVIDFIDMIELRNRSFVERTLRNLLRNDKARVQIGRISNFGLLEMSRQYLKPSFLELNTIPCEHCKGRGVIKSNETNASVVFKTIEREILSNKNIGILNVYLSPKATLFMLNHKRKEIKDLEEKHQISIYVLQDYNVGADSFAMETVSKRIKQNKNYIALHEDKTHVEVDEKVGDTLSADKLNTTDNEKRKLTSQSKIRTKKSTKRGYTNNSNFEQKEQSKLDTKKTRTKKVVPKKEVRASNKKSVQSNAKNNETKSRKTSKVTRILNKLLG